MIGYARFLLPTYMLDATVTASGEETGFGASNALETQERSLVWRAPAGSGAHLDFVFSEPETVNAIVIANSSLSYEGAYLLEGGSTPGDDDVFSAEFDAWEPLWAIDEMPIDLHSIDGYPSLVELPSYYPSGTLRLKYFNDLPMAKYWRLNFQGPAWESEFNPDGRIQAGAVILGAYLQADRRIKAPDGSHPKDETKLVYTEGNQHSKDEGPRYRENHVVFENLDAAQVMGPWYDMVQALGVGTCFVADLYPGANSQVVRIRNQLYCYLTKTNSMPMDGLYGQVTLDIREAS